MDWRSIVDRAAETSADARALVEPVVRLMGKVPFLVALEEACRGNDKIAWPEEQLAAVRAALSILSSLLYDLRGRVDGHVEPRDEVTSRLGRMVTIAAADPEAERTAGASWRPGDPACPRCGSIRIDTTHMGALGERFYETFCRACHESAGWFESACDGHAWRRESLPERPPP